MECAGVQINMPLTRPTPRDPRGLILFNSNRSISPSSSCPISCRDHVFQDQDVRAQMISLDGPEHPYVTVCNIEGQDDKFPGNFVGTNQGNRTYMIL